MNIIKIISEHKKIKKSQPLQHGFKRVEAVVNNFGHIETQHVDIEN